MATRTAKKGGRQKAKPFSAVAAVKRNARERLGQPPAEKVIPERTTERQREKHKPGLADLVALDPDA